tara:strand:+ start:969 stop:1181 length:213 start_codon:yes stop_codon:yes gene_type:complete
MALMVSVSSSPPHNLNGIGLARMVSNGGTTVSTTTVSKTTNILLFGSAGDGSGGGGGAATGSEAQSWSDG